mgnify:CR=1 FL=1|tara:strand:+ start:787 stop:1104 length:318 start_codon:yes stop_codon:yes gene_type:complete
MNDTDKYEGHTPGPWKADYDFPRHRQIQTGLVGPSGKDLGHGYDNDDEQIANAQLIIDAPLLLAEVKRLRERLDLAERYIINPYLRNYFADVVSKGLDDERDNLG